jgi:menaquinol-cytochrome c reductase iron-sulfur subunit
MEWQEGWDRKTFCLACIYGLWALMGGALAIPAVAYLLFPPRARKDDEWVDAGDLAQLPVRVPEEVTFRRNRVDGWKVTSERATAWVVKFSEHKVVAYTPQCTHLGCAYHWDEQKQNFLCPCHSSTFALDGRVLSGPAPRPLDRFQVRVDEGKLLLGPPMNQA